MIEHIPARYLQTISDSVQQQTATDRLSSVHLQQMHGHVPDSVTISGGLAAHMVFVSLPVVT